MKVPRLWWGLLIFLGVWAFCSSWVVVSLAAAYTLGYYAGYADFDDLLPWQRS